MSKIYVTKEVTYQREYLDKMMCDLCGRESPDEDWGTGVYDVDETEVKVNTVVKQEDGYSYPEGGAGTKIDIDI